MQLKNKRILLTGATGGIGRHLALMLARKGANLALVGRDTNKLEELTKEIISKGGNAQIIVADFDVAGTPQQVTVQVTEKLGGIDILINNAGITKDNLLMRMSEEDFDKVIDVNLKSVFNMTKAIQRTFLKQRAGSIINMSSVVGVKGNAGQTNYAASKAGVIGFTKSVALELGSRNIRCNAIAPGFIETEMTAKLSAEVVQGWRDGIPLKRGGTTEDVANACLFLASDMSAYVTGQVLNVCGGMLT